MRLYLIRHPRPDVAPGICYGSSEVSCAQETLAQAACLLWQTLPRELAVFSSPRQRCQQLAQQLCALEPAMVYQTDKRLREMDFGAWEGRPWAEIPQPELSAWTHDFAHYRCGGGDSAAQLVARVAQALMDQIQRRQDAIWVTHAGVIRALHWLATQPLQTLSFWARQPLRPPQPLDLRAADWPQIEVPWAQALIWDWPPAATGSG